MDHEGNDSAFDDATWPDVVHVAKYAFLHHATRNRVVMWEGLCDHFGQIVVIAGEGVGPFGS